MPKYIIRRTVEITMEVECVDPKEASRIFYANESSEGEYNELDLEMWDVTNDNLHERIDITEWNI